METEGLNAEITAKIRGYDQTIKILNGVIYFMHCTCWNFENRRTRKVGRCHDIKFVSSPCKHLAQITSPLIRFRHCILKTPDFNVGSTYCPASLRREIIGRAKGVCEVPGCKENLTDIHRRIRKANGGRYNADNCMGLCNSHHRKFHENEFQGVHKTY